MELEKKIKQEIDNIKEQLVEWRRDFHQHPELGFTEMESGDGSLTHPAPTPEGGRQANFF